MARPDYYAILGVPRDADAAEIKRAYRRVALESHPDRFPDDDDAHERFRLASEAYEVLSDPAKRSRYDSSRIIPDAIDLTRPPSVATARDLFGNLFGDVFGSRRAKRRKGRDIRYTLSVTLADVVLGSTHTISFEGRGACERCEGSGREPGGREPIECPNCGGSGEVKTGGLLSRRSRCGRCDGMGMIQQDPCTACRGRGVRKRQRSFDVRLPPGTEAGSEKILRGEGEPGRFGGEAGNLRVTINVRPHRWLRREGMNLVARIPVPISRAALGGKIPVPTIDGWVDMDLPAGVASGAKLRLRGKGVPDSRGGRGDQLVEIHVETPKLPEGSRSRELLLELDRAMAREGVLPEHAELVAALEAHEAQREGN
ncbi:DnaJ domain-containing protein [Pseudenhygromyxa sp. WMMC2535]|uniref:DnaJ C-terminal domain-containing protein n=1 Tax=Pseudenhygromyxa sp. WMMC2535 TaxID=2712867 RepID=UPI00155405A6|nr:DnaJ C-terminal domain-containing protein [Pseudenhygromyxa sp. WMMC2535]NVB41185.1 DnaJ domain-containing protein [Pseudenhygromyxa sp. WMMC2535]